MTNLEITNVLIFAKYWLKIKSNNFIDAFVQLSFNKDRNWAGIFYQDCGMIYFNGEPSINTIFHESVHYKQFEEGRCEYRKNYLKLGGSTKIKVYCREPIEIEACNKAFYMSLDYRKYKKNIKLKNRQYNFDESVDKYCYNKEYEYL